MKSWQGSSEQGKNASPSLQLPGGANDAAYSLNRRAEEGYSIKYSSAQEIKNAVNSFLAERGLGQVSLDKLGLKLE